jgi:hypothetical protein
MITMKSRHQPHWDVDRFGGVVEWVGAAAVVLALMLMEACVDWVWR